MRPIKLDLVPPFGWILRGSTPAFARSRPAAAVRTPWALPGLGGLGIGQSRRSKPTAHHDGGSLRRRHIAFLVALGTLLAAVLIGPYAVVRSNALYCRHSRVFWDPVDCYKFGLRERSADVVMVGDSSLVFGIQPRLVEKQAHVSAINLGLSAGGVIFFPKLLLDHYLKRNAPPRMIVLYVSPWTMVRDNPDMPHLWNDGARVAVRHGNLSEVASIFLQDPRRLIQFPMIVLQQGWSQFSLSQAWWRAASTEMDRDGGWFAPQRPGRPASVQQPAEDAALSDRCRLAAKPLGRPERAMFDRFRATYERDGIPVLIYVAPIPACDPSIGPVVAAYREIADNRPQTLPGHDFIDDGWRVHLDAAGSAEATRQFAAFLSGRIGPRRAEAAVLDRRSVVNPF